MTRPDWHDAARRLRRGSTEAEAASWRLLRDRSPAFKVRRQHPAPPNVADFACVAPRLIVQVDGGRHGPARDGDRGAAMQAQGRLVPRYWNNEVLGSPEGVPAQILPVAGKRYGG